MNKMILMLSLMATQVALAQSLSLSLGIEKAEKGGGAKTFNVNRINVETVALRGHHEKSDVNAVWVNYDDGTAERLSQLERTLRQGDYVEARVDYRRYVRSVSVDASSGLIGSRGRYEVLITYNDRPAPYDPPQRPTPPNRPRPPERPEPPRRPEPPSYGADLRGYCDDYDHREFAVAKDFAYSSAGLDKDTNGATTWAIDYVRTHRCGTIQEYKLRFSKLKTFAYNSDGLNFDANNAINWALGYVEYLEPREIDERIISAKSIREFAYSSNGLNKDDKGAARISERWFAERCDSDSRVRLDFWPQFRREYDFAYSSSGLNYDDNRARQYALDRTERMLRCGYLLR